MTADRRRYLRGCSLFLLVLGFNGVVKADLSSFLNSATNAVNNAANTTSAALQRAANSTTNAVQSATDKATNAFSTAQNKVTQQTHNFVSDINNLTAVVGDDVARHINNTVFLGQRHPLVFWPAYGTSRVHVAVQGNAAPNCPASGSFTASFGHPTLLDGFPESCVYPLLQMRYNASTGTFANAPGVNTSIADFGGQFCAPIPYEPLFAVAQAIGYTSGKDFFVACYDWRTTPSVDVGSDGPHLQRAQQLVEAAYTNSGGLPVYLAGHSNGPQYALALLRAMSAEWRAKYVAGFISYAGNWMGQGSVYSQIFAGASLFDNRVYGPSAPAYESWPSTYMSASSPAYYGTSEVVARTTNATGAVPPRDYTPADALQLFKDAGLATAQQLAPLLLNNGSANSTPPGTHFYGFIGTGVRTLVGNTFASATQQQAPLANGAIYSADGGDGNQENADNVAITPWARLQDPCLHFELNREQGAEHLALPFTPSVVKRTVEILFTTPAACGGVAMAPGESGLTVHPPAPGVVLQGVAASPANPLAGRRLLATA